MRTSLARTTDSSGPPDRLYVRLTEKNSATLPRPGTLTSTPTTQMPPDPRNTCPRDTTDTQQAHRRRHHRPVHLTAEPAAVSLTHLAGRPARRRRPVDRQGQPRQAGAVRLHGPGHRQRRWHRPGPHPGPGQPGRRSAARPAIERGHQAHRVGAPGPLPPTAATGRKVSTMPCTSWACAPWQSPQGQARQGPPGRRAPARVPAHHEMADRKRRRSLFQAEVARSLEKAPPSGRAVHPTGRSSAVTRQPGPPIAAA
jgi:hypothetical protein